MASIAENLDAPKEKSLKIVIPIFNRFSELNSLLSQLAKQSHQNFEIVLIDHGTNDFSKPSVPFPLTVLKRSSDLWFTGAVNEGLRWILQQPTPSSHVMILNDDVQLEGHDWLEKMLNACPPNEFVCSSARSSDGTLIYSGLSLSRIRFRFVHIDQGQSEPSGGEKYESDTLPTRGIVFPFESLEKVGLLNEKDLPQYGSDYEWTTRAKRVGYRLSVLRSASLKTTLNPVSFGVSGRKKYSQPKLLNFFRDLFNPYKTGSLSVSYRMGRSIFSRPYLYVFMGYHFLRKTAGFVLTNYIKN